MTLEEDLRAAVLRGDEKACVARLHGVKEKERSAAAAEMLRLFDGAHTLWFGRDGSKGAKKLGLAEIDRDLKEKILDAARSALLGTTSQIEGLRKYSWRSIPEEASAVAILSDRRPPWVLAWAELVCEIAPSRWSIVRALVRAGISPKPATDGYVLGMIAEAHRRKRGWVASGTERPKPLFEDDPELLDGDVWRVFEVEGNREISLTSMQSFWRGALLEWEKNKRLERGRMLDGTLNALARDFPQHKAGFYSRLHDDLAPTLPEISARATAYVELLASRIPPTVALATRAVSLVAKNGALDVGAFARAATSAVRSGQQTALTLLGILGSAKGPDAILATVPFLEHESVEVVDAVLAILEAVKKPTPALVAHVAPLANAVAASRRKRLAAWLEANGGKVKSVLPIPVAPIAPAIAIANADDLARAGVAALSAAAPAGPWPRVMVEGAPCLDRGISPIASHEELLDAVVRALEEPNDRVGFERVLDGISRLGRPAEQPKPVAKRAATLLRRMPDGAPLLVDGWLAKSDGKAEEPRPRTPLREFARRRITNVLERLVRGETRPLLAFPSTETFFVDPKEIAPRLRALDKAPIDIEDAVVALLRLAPDGRKQALADLRKVKGPLASVFRHALGSDKEEIPGDAPAALWLAAARARGGDDAAVMRAYPNAGPDGGEAARSSFRWKRIAMKGQKATWLTLVRVVTPARPAKIPLDRFAILLAAPREDELESPLGGEPDVREIAACCPLDRRMFFARGGDLVAGNVDWSSAAWENHVFLEPLIDPDVALEEHALFLLAIALNAKEPRENALAVDALVGAITDGRIVGPELGPPMAFFWDPLHDDVTYSHRPPASRWAKSFGAVARTSSLHAEIVRRIIEGFFAAAPAAPPADVHALLQLWLDLAIEAGTGVPEPARASLLPIGKSGKAKAIATRLLALPFAPSALASDAHALAIAGRVARAERWTRNQGLSDI